MRQNGTYRRHEMMLTDMLKLVAVSPLLLFSFACAGEVKYRTSIEVVERSGCAYLEIAYYNSSDEVMFFQPDEPAILLMDAGMRRMPFVGIIAKRPEYALEEHLRLPPGQVLRREISLGESYGLRKSGKYTILVNVDYFDPVSQKGQEKGNIVKVFQYSGRCRKF